MKLFATTSTIQRKASVVLILAVLLVPTACSDRGPADKRIKQIDPKQTAEMAKAIEATFTPQLAEGFTLKLWGVDSLVADPVSIDIDDYGKIYYTRTNRQKNSEFDIRGHQDWEIGSIALCESGRLLVALVDRLVRLDPASGAIEPLGEVRVHHAGDRRLPARADIGHRPRDRTGRRQAPGQRRHHVGHALCEELDVRVVASAGHLVGDHGG